MDAYTRECFLFSIYPSLILFLKYIRKLNNNSFIGFLSRDAYFLFKLYENMYPKQIRKIDYDYVYSSRICLTLQDNSYLSYIKRLQSNSKKNNIIFVDIFGSGKTFLEFINKHNLSNIKIIFFKLDTQRFNDYVFNRKNLVSGFYINNYMFEGLFLEYIFRANHKKVIKVDKNNKPVYLDNDMDNVDQETDKYSNLLLKLYNQILYNMKYHPNIRYFTLQYFNYKLNGSKAIKYNINIENKKYKGLVVLDIDDTITNVQNYSFIRQIIKLSLAKNIKIICVTSRQKPYMFGPKNNQRKCKIENILNKIGFNFKDNLIDIWYNPFTFLEYHKNLKDDVANVEFQIYHNNNNPSNVKLKTIEKVMKLYNIKPKNVIFFDDSNSHINECKKLNITTVLVKRNIGISIDSLKKFKYFLTKL
jgi:hypothetical protein